MAQTTIEWTSVQAADGRVFPGYTFNAWRGCDKVSTGCDNCYAETLSKRNPAVLGIWGKDGSRPIAAEKYWKQPELWNALAAAEGVRLRVFCLSLGDVFENRDELRAPRLRLLDLIRRTPHLDWLLLTKRPKNIMPLLMQAWQDAAAVWRNADFRTNAERAAEDLTNWLEAWREGHAPANVWLGTSVEDQERADQRVPALLKVPAAVRFLSCEPLLGPVSLKVKWARIPVRPADYERLGVPAPTEMWSLNDALVGWPADELNREKPSIHWVIVGGESGHGARPMHPDWARALRDQCDAAGVAFLFKQWGAWAPYQTEHDADPRVDHTSSWPDGTVGAGSAAENGGTGRSLQRVGKKAAGRLLDGRTHDGFPTPATSRAPSNLS